MSLLMKSRILIGTPQELMGPTDPTRTDLIFSEVRTVRLEEDRTSPISTLQVAFPPDIDPAKLHRLRKGNILRWEAGLWEDGIEPQNTKEPDGYHPEFEGIITGVSRKDHYDGWDPNGFLGGKRRDDTFILVEVQDYMYLLAQTGMKGKWGGTDLYSAVGQILQTDGLAIRFGLAHRQLYNTAYVVPNGVELKYDPTPAAALYRIRRVNGFQAHEVIGIDTYFRLKELYLRDPNDPTFHLEPDFPAFIKGWNIIEEDLAPRAATNITVRARWYNSRTGQYISDYYPKEGTKPYVVGKQIFGTVPVERVVDVNGDGMGGPGNLTKTAADIYAHLSGNGFTGSFLTLGSPPVHRGDMILYIGDGPDHEKAVIVDSVIKVYDTHNHEYFQHIRPGYTPTPIVNQSENEPGMAAFARAQETRAEFTARVSATMARIIAEVKSAKGL